MKALPLVSACTAIALLINPASAQQRTPLSAGSPRPSIPIFSPPPPTPVIGPQAMTPAAPCKSCAVWTPYCNVRIGAIALQRANSSSVPLVLDDNGNVVFDSSRFDFDYEVGIDINVRYALTPIWDIEARYFGVDNWVSRASGLVPTATGTIATSPPTPFGGGPGQANFAYGSRLYSGEINVGRNVSPDLRFLTGLRYLEVSEHMTGVFAPITPFALDADVNNRLFGLQLGVDGLLMKIGNRIDVRGFGKVGALINHADQDTVVTDPPGTAFSSGRASRDAAAFLAEAGLNATIRLGRNWSAYAGYQLLWIDGVALAPDQVPSTGSLGAGTTAPARVDTSDVLYHGGSVGLEFRF